MIDLHFHCLPSLDDGPAAWDDAVALCRQAAAEGTTKIVATPHVLRERWLNDVPARRDELILKLNTLLGGRPSILPGCEYFFSTDAVELWEQGNTSPIYGLNRSRYLLVEFPATVVPREAENVIYELRFVGAVPIIAHPERNLVFARDPRLLAAFVEAGALTQITAASLIGEFGKLAQNACVAFHAAGLIHTVASDAHSLARRPPRLAAAYSHALNVWGREDADRIFLTNAEAVIDNQNVIVSRDPASAWNG